MRSFFWLWVMFLLVCLVTDSASYWVVRDRLGQSLELALDAALISGIAEEDLIWGKQLFRREVATERAAEILRKNAGSLLAESLTFHFEMRRDGDQISAEGQAGVRIPFLLGALAGGGGKEITVSRKMVYQGMYK